MNQHRPTHVRHSQSGVVFKSIGSRSARAGGYVSKMVTACSVQRPRHSDAPKASARNSRADTCASSSATPTCRARHRSTQLPEFIVPGLPGTRDDPSQDITVQPCSVPARVKPRSYLLTCLERSTRSPWDWTGHTHQGVRTLNSNPNSGTDNAATSPPRIQFSGRVDGPLF